MSSMTRPKICTNLLTSAKLRFSTNSVRLKSHYDALGVSKKATQNDIKSAYYKLSKIYHPDMNKSEEAKQKFRGITEAYEILGNYKSRRMYDRGMRPGPKQMEHETPEEVKKQDAQTRFYKSRLNRTQVPTRDGRTPIYNFDEWTRAHYGDIFNQTMRIKENIEHSVRQKEAEDLKTQDTRFWAPILMVFFLVGTILLTSNIEDDLDRNKLTSVKKEQRSS